MAAEAKKEEEREQGTEAEKELVALQQANAGLQSSVRAMQARLHAQVNGWGCHASKAAVGRSTTMMLNGPCPVLS